MPGLLRAVPVTDAERRANDRHRLSAVLAVVGVLGLYVFFLTDAAAYLGLPAPRDLVASVGLTPDHVFDPDDGNVESELRIGFTRLWDGDEERLLLFGLLLVAFLCAYFLPLAWKQPALVIASVCGIGLLYGPRGAAGLLFAHSVVYLMLHPKRGSPLPGAVPGALAALAFTGPGCSLAAQLGALLLLALASGVAYRWLLLPLLARPRIAPVLRTLVVQSALLTVCAAALVEGLTGLSWSLPLGVFLFFWQWVRVIMYELDRRDGRIPEQVSPFRYLAVFLSPGVIAVWQWGIAIGQGYAYVHDNFLCRDKNEIVLSGARLLLLALVYLALADWIGASLVGVFDALGVPVYGGSTRQMVHFFTAGGDVGTLSVLATTLLDMIKWIFTWGGVFHFKVGVWRICGYRFDPCLDRPWAATNLVALWPRITFHYREFLVRAFYYPVFFRCFKKRRRLRILAATLAAAGLGNLVWGHVVEHLYYEGMSFDVLAWELRTWPYFLLLGTGIGLTELTLRWRRRQRRPWSPGPRLLGDVIAAYCTLQFFTMIRIFRRGGEQAEIWDLWRLFLRGLGIHL